MYIDLRRRLKGFTTSHSTRGKQVGLQLWHSAPSPFVTLLSRRDQSGGRSSFGKRVWFTESRIILIISFLLVILFNQFILHIK